MRSADEKVQWSMRGMKVTVDAAMRARDVSRPRADHEETARAVAPEPVRPRAQPSRPVLPEDPAAPAAGQADGAPKARRPHRRRRRR
jgi:hypothetical protein